MNTLSIGDFLLRPKFLGVTHVGVWMGGGAVFHNAPGRGEHISSLAEFARGAPVWIQPKNADSSTVINRVRSKLSRPHEYDLISNNCEHAANEVVTGKPFSDQLCAVVVIAMVIGTAWVALRKP